MIDYPEIERLLEKFAKVTYPKINCLGYNPKYAQMLYDDFAGELGELTAVTQYIYESFELQENTKLSTVLVRIAISEMKHLDILGKLIRRMGNTPSFKSSKGTYWNAENLMYQPRNRVEMMRRNIYAEQEAIKGYQKAKQYTNNRELIETLDKIIEEEKSHIEIFEIIMRGCK